MYGCVGQFALCHWHIAGKHLGGAVPNLIHIAILLNLTIKVAAKHERQFLVGGLLAGWSYHKVALCHVFHNACGAFFIELGADNRYRIVACEWVERKFEAFLDACSILANECRWVGHRCNDALIEC